MCCLLPSPGQCYVVDTGKSGCFVRLDGSVPGRVLLKLLSDGFVADPSKEFPAGRLVAGKVLEKVGKGVWEWKIRVNCSKKNPKKRYWGGTRLGQKLFFCFVLVFVMMVICRGGGIQSKMWPQNR